MQNCKVNGIECCECQQVCESRSNDDNMNDKTSLNYENECNMLREMIYRKENEWKESEKEYLCTLRRYEEEIRLLKAKLSMVELIFGQKSEL